MKKFISLFALFVSLVLSVFSQPLINQNDMPNIGDTLRVNISSSTNGLDYTSSGSNYLWDFSSFTPTSQRVDTFKNVLSTSIIYYIYFNDATIAGTQPDMIPVNAGITTISITNVYGFFKEAAASYSQLGFGAKFNGTPLPVKYDNPDVTLYFPVAMGEKDSCDFSYNVSIPSMGYFGEKKHRVNYVDGWGTVITPIDTFQAMRVLSKITAHDSIHLDTFGGIPYAFDYNVTEYKWYADNMGIPVMKITVRTGTGADTSIEYNNKPGSHAGLTDIEASLMFVSLYPNPVNENTNLYFSLAKPSEVEINIYDVLGKNIKNIANKEFPAGFHSLPFATGDMQKGIYFIRISDDSVTKVLKLQVL